MRKLHWSILKRLYRLRPRFAVYQRLEQRWLLDNRNWIDQQLIIRRPYEVAQIARCRALIREHRLQSFFDIGANFGLYSVLLARETGVAEVHAFEPLPRNANQLRANLFLNDLDGRVLVRNQAVGDHAGSCELFVDPGSTGVSTLIPDESHRDQRAYQSVVAVEAVVFDEQFAPSGTRALVKIDVEGAELQVLRGMSRFLADNQVVLQVETTPGTQQAVEALLTGAGYRALDRIGADAYYANL